MKGDGYGNAMPGRTISPNEAVTMVLRAVGYTDNASVLVGQWPANYVALGQNQNLYEDVANDLQMNKASAAQMIYNALTAQLVQVDANSLVTLLYDPGPQGEQIPRSLLTTGLNCYRDPNSSGKRVVTYADAKDSKINLIPKVGAYGVLYRSKVDNEVVALTDVETEFLAGRFYYKSNGDADVFQAVDGTRYSLSSDAKTVANGFNILAGEAGYGSDRVTRPSDPGYVSPIDVSAIATGGALSTVFLNGEDVGTWADSESDKYIYNNTAGTGNVASKLIISAKVNGLTVLDVRSVAVWDAALGDGRGDAFLYESGQIDGKKFNGHDFPLDVNNEVDPYGYVLAGIDSLDDLAVDNVVYVYKNADKKIVRIDVGTETQSGTITNVNTTDFVRTIGGKVIVFAPGDYEHSTQSDLKINNEGTALLDIYGRSFAFRLGEASKGNFAVVMDYQTSSSWVGGTPDYKVFDKTGKEVVYTLKDGSPTASRHQLIEYKLSGGKLQIVSNPDHWTAAGNGYVNKGGTILSVGPSGSRTNHLIDSSAIVYVKDGNDYSLGSIQDLLDVELDDGPFNYILNESGSVAAMWVDIADAGAQSVFVMINSISYGADGTDEFDIVNGLNFADGAGAASKSWDFTDSTLVSKLNSIYTNGSSNRGRYDRLVKFTIGEDGTLKALDLLDGTGSRVDSYYSAETGATVTLNGSSFVTGRNDGSGGTFTLGVNDGTTTSALDFVAFEANTVLYRLSGSSWIAEKPTTGNFNSLGASAEYVFVKTDKDNAYDVIIRVDNL
jgi:hypothetical protein